MSYDRAIEAHYAGVWALPIAHRRPKTGPVHELSPEFAVLERSERDPAFVVKRRLRWVALARINGEIRYYAGPIPPGSDAARGAGSVHVDPDEHESQPWELGVLECVEDAVTQVAEYLADAELSLIDVPRTLYSCGSR